MSKPNPRYEDNSIVIYCGSLFYVIESHWEDEKGSGWFYKLGNSQLQLIPEDKLKPQTVKTFKDNLIPAAQSFDCTHGRINNFLLGLKKSPANNRWTWHIVFAGNPTVCPKSLLDVISSPTDYLNAKLCRDAATKESKRLSDLAFNEYLQSGNK